MIESLKLYLVEQDTDGLLGEYLCACVVIAKDERQAVKAALALGDAKNGVGVTVLPDRLKAIYLGDLAVLLKSRHVRHGTVTCGVLAVTTGEHTIRRRG